MYYNTIRVTLWCVQWLALMAFFIIGLLVLRTALSKQKQQAVAA